MFLVTGITGHSGKYFLQELIDHKYQEQIRCIVRETSDTSMLDNSGLNIDKVVGDIEDPLFMDEIMKDIDLVLHIAGIQKTLNVIRAATSNNVKSGIFVHTTGIYSKFKSASEDYLNIENEIKMIIKDKGHPIKVTILRPTMIYGDLCDLNMSKFIKMVDYLRVFPIIEHGRSLIQPVNARDLGRAYYQVATMDQNLRRAEYVVSGERPIEMIEAFKIISDNLGKKTFFMSFPLRCGVLLAQILKIIFLGKIDYVEKVQRMGENRSFPHDYAKNDFNFAPMSFEKGIAIEVRQYLDNKRR